MPRISLEKNFRKEINIQIYDLEINHDKLLGRAVYEDTRNNSIQLKSFDGAFNFESLVRATTTYKRTEKISLALTIAGAKDLDNSDYIGNSDPYIVATYGNKVFKSKTIHYGSKNLHFLRQNVSYY